MMSLLLRFHFLLSCWQALKIFCAQRDPAKCCSFPNVFTPIYIKTIIIIWLTLIYRTINWAVAYCDKISHDKLWVQSIMLVQTAAPSSLVFSDLTSPIRSRAAAPGSTVKSPGSWSHWSPNTTPSWSSKIRPLEQTSPSNLCRLWRRCALLLLGSGTYCMPKVEKYFLKVWKK